jgi:hypothetical protein
MLATGAVGLRGRWVALANVVGTVARVVLIWGAGQRFPTMAQTCAAWTPWVVIPGMATAVVCGAVRWHQRLRNGPTPAPGERPCPVS